MYTTVLGWIVGLATARRLLAGTIGRTAHRPTGSATGLAAFRATDGTARSLEDAVAFSTTAIRGVTGLGTTTAAGACIAIAVIVQETTGTRAAGVTVARGKGQEGGDK